MPKMKTHRGAAKRFKLTASGKVKRARANRRHILTGKPAKRQRQLRQNTTLVASDEHVKKLIPYM